MSIMNAMCRRLPVLRKCSDWPKEKPTYKPDLHGGQDICGANRTHIWGSHSTEQSDWLHLPKGSAIEGKTKEPACGGFEACSTSADISDSLVTNRMWCMTSEFRWFNFSLSLSPPIPSLLSSLLLSLPPFPSFSFPFPSLPFLSFSPVSPPSLSGYVPWNPELPCKKFSYLEASMLEREYVEPTLRRRCPRSPSCSSPQLLMFPAQLLEIRIKNTSIWASHLP